MTDLTAADMTHRRSRHWEMLVMSTAALGLSWVLEVGNEGRVFFRGFPDWPVPQTCFSRQIFGVDCPGCGLTRSYVYLIHGHLAAAWAMHRVGWLMFIMTVLQIPYRWLAIRHQHRELIPMRVSKIIGGTLIALLILNWLLGIFLQQIPHANGS